MISDAHEGIKAATARVPSTTWQRCRVHFQRNAPAHAGHTGPHGAPRHRMGHRLRPAPPCGDRGTVAPHGGPGARQAPEAGPLMDAAEEGVPAYMTFPQQHRASLHSTHPIDRLNGDIKRRTDVVGIFPNGIDPAPPRRDPDGADGGMDSPARQLHNAGNAGAGLRRSPSQPACSKERLTNSARLSARGPR